MTEDFALVWKRICDAIRKSILTMSLHSDHFLLQTVCIFFQIFQIVLKVFLFPILSVLPSFSTSETSVLNLEKFVYEARIDGYFL